MIYLDNHRATRPSSKVIEKISKELWIAPDAPYFNDPRIVQELERGLGNIYDLTGAAKDTKFILTSGDEDSATRVFNKAYREVVYKEGKNFLLAPITENASIRKAMDSLEEVGCVSKFLPVNENGELTVEILEKHYTPKAGLLSLSWANALTGVIQPIEEIANYCQKHGILLYVQGSEMFAKLFMRLEDLPIDYFSFSADLFHGPKGVGGLFLNKKIDSFKLADIRNLPGLIGMGIAAGEVLDFMDGMSTETAYLRSYLEDGLSKLIGGIQFFGRSGQRLPNTSCFAIPGLHAEYLTFLLNQKNVVVSYGGARVQKLEYQLLEMGIDPVMAKSAISVALSMDTSELEIKKAIAIISDIKALYD